MITVCTPLEPRTIAKIADSAMALSRKKPCFFVKIGTRSLGQCWITTHIAATRMIARSAPSRSSPAPSARRYAALGLDRSARPSKRGNHAANAYLTMLARTEDKRSSDSVRQVEYWFPHISRTASRQPGLVISTQVPAQPAKNIAVRPFVAAERCHHETLQFSLDSVHPCTYPIHSRLEQCRLQRMYGFLLCGPILPREHIGSRSRERVTDPVGPSN